MSKPTLRRYRFATEAQWNKCLIAQGDREQLGQTSSLSPFAPYERVPKLYGSPGAYAPAISPIGDILWRDINGCLNRLTSECSHATQELQGATDSAYDAEPVVVSAPAPVAAATRIISTATDLWVIGDAPNSLIRYEQDSLVQLATAELPNLETVDIAAGPRGTIFALVSQSDSEQPWQIVHLDCTGHVLETVTLESCSDCLGFTFLRRSRQFVVLTRETLSNKEISERLCWFSTSGGKPEFILPVAALRPCFHVTDNDSEENPCDAVPGLGAVLCSDSHGRIFLAGEDGKDFCGGTYIVVLDSDGNLLDQIPLDPADAPVTGLAAGDRELLAAGPNGLLQYLPSQTVPDTVGDVSCTLITPMLHSPEMTDARGWLRADVLGNLPEGATLEIAVAATSDPAVIDRMNAIASDEKLSDSQRIRKLLNVPEVWRPGTAFQGRELQANEGQQSYSAPLFDIREPYIWIAITLSASAEATLPAITQLDVLYPNLGLMDELPAVYKRSSGQQPFLRSLVGVLEATTQDLDAQIGSLGSLVNPSTAPPDWLDFVARWLGLPWDDALKPEQKQCLMQHASDLARQRGTRAGLETLLTCLVPGVPKRFRITDTTADFGFAIVGDDACPGSKLPAMLGGFTRWNAALGERSVLGYMRLPCPNPVEDPARWWAGKVRVEIAATGEERKVWEPWFQQLVSEMVPLSARVELVWVSAYALRSDRLDDTLVLEMPPVAHLGTDAITDVARLAEGDTRISSAGPRIGTRLR